MPESTASSSDNGDVLALRPSQVIRPPSVSNNSLSDANANNRGASKKNTSKKKNNRRRNKGGTSGATNGDASKTGQDANADCITTTQQPSTTPAPPPKQQSRRKTDKKNKEQPSNNSDGQLDEAIDQKPSQNTQKKKKNRRRNNNKKHPWRKQVPDGAVDPITLDPIRQLQYPPFALVADEPFEPVPVWPVPPEENDNVKPSPVETEEERKRRLKAEEERRIAEQWGSHAAAVVSADEEEEEDQKKDTKPPVPKHKRPFNLYDGRALAYYMVSQLQFIDPLNRRDLTRDELLNLDAYLQRHGFRDLNVTEAYDAKGVTVSTAGAAGNTAAGRAAILQQEASGMLQALFGGRTGRQQPPSSQRQQGGGSNTLMSLYEAHEEQQGQQQRRPRERRPIQEDTGIVGSAGFLVVDDALNPGLRGAAPEFVPSGGNASSLYSASHITDRYAHQSMVREQEFPSLASPAVAAPPAATAPTNRRKPAASKTLSKIGSAVRKTDPEEVQRQFEARELARKKAMMSNLTFGSNPASWEQPVLPSQAFAAPENATTEAQLARNRAFAEALNVTPATARTNINSGWARPTERPVDQFGNELQTTLYPLSLIEMAREKMEVVLKIEKKWKTFLADDTAASLPLNRMDRPTRTLIHEYSDFWKLHTESFDPEPNRYIHCVKLRDTRAPHPLLSYVVRHGQQAHFPQQSDHSALQTAGQNTSGRSLPLPPERAPLPLKPRSQIEDDDGSRFAKTSLSLGGAPSRTMGQEEPSSRFAGLGGRERPRLQLQRRTLPVELPPPAELKEEVFDIAEQLARQKQRAEEKERKEREEAEQKQRILEAAFASDEEEGGGADDDSVWDEPEPLYTGEDEEE